VKCVVAFVLVSLASWSSAQVQPRGSEDTFDLVAWNIENFPLQGQATVDSVRMIILALQVDLVTVEEIADTTAFHNLVNSLEDWAGVYSSDQYGPGNYQKTGILYRTDQITLSNVGIIFPNEPDPFPRPPLMAHVDFDRGNQHFDFHLIVVHLKAGGAAEDLARRREACQMLKGLIDQSVNEGDEPDFIVAGDFNDELDDPPASNSFTIFLDDTAHYQFLTMPLAGDPYWASYPSTGTLIDHILVTSDALGEYQGGETTTLRLDYEVTDYSYWVSDHRPVMSQFPVGTSGVIVVGPGKVPSDDRILGSFPNPFNSSVAIHYVVQALSPVTITIYNVLGRKVAVLADGYQAAGTHRLMWDGADSRGLSAPSGIYIVNLSTGHGHFNWKIALIK